MRFLRRSIPIAIALILGATVLVSWIDPLKVLVRFPLDAGSLVIKGTKITMEAPKLSGYTREQRWYEMNAKGATQDVTKPDLIELSEIRAKMETQDKTTFHLSSKDGLYNRKPRMIYALTNFQALCGFRPPRDAARLLAGLRGSWRPPASGHHLLDEWSHALQTGKRKGCAAPSWPARRRRPVGRAGRLTPPGCWPAAPAGSRAGIHAPAPVWPNSTRGSRRPDLAAAQPGQPSTGPGAVPADRQIHAYLRGSAWR